MDGARLAELERRVAGLARGAQRWRAAAIIAGGLLGVVGLVGATDRGDVLDVKEVRAKSFVLANAAGQMRASLNLYGVDEQGDGFPRLSLYDLVGSERMALSLYLDEGVPFIALYHRSGQERTLEAPRLKLAVSPDGTSTIELRDAPGAPLATLSVEGGAPKLTLTDKQGNTRAVLGHSQLEATRTGAVAQRPASSLVLFDKDGKVLFKAP